jgi:hypothetical protein
VSVPSLPDLKFNQPALFFFQTFPVVTMKLIRLTLFFATLFCITLPSLGQSTNKLSLEVLPRDEHGWIRLNAAGQTGRVYTLNATTNLVDWSWIATLHDGIAAYADPASSRSPVRFYRADSTLKNATNDWKNQIHFPQDDFLSEPGDLSGPDFRWIKFSIPLQDPVRVYYQNSQKYDFHFDFAKARLEPFRNMTATQFEQAALRTNNQQVLLGTVLFPPPPSSREYGIQFVGADPYPPESLARFFDLVRSTIAADPSAAPFYVPTYEQVRVAETNQAYFESRGIRVASPERWISSDYAYSTGWALGRLKFFAGSEINQAYFDGRLQPQDILLTDEVPSEIPILAGVLSLRPSTPNSHVAILARSYGWPFAYIADPQE